VLFKSLSDPNPSGLCLCGCGTAVSVVKKNRPEREQYIGNHLRYVSGHNQTVPRTAFLRTDHFCVGCSTRRPISDFYRNSSRTSGRHCRCKDCMKKAVASFQRTPRGRLLKRRRDRLYREQQRPYCSADLDRERYRRGHVPATRPEHKRRAGLIIREQIRRGLVSRPSSCQSCGNPVKVDAHHPDYAKPLDVEFLCRRCHGHRHRIPE
jgi:hypothetical protein